MAFGPCCIACPPLKEPCLSLASLQPAPLLWTVLSSLFSLPRAEASLVFPNSFRQAQPCRKPGRGAGSGRRATQCTLVCLQRWPQSVVQSWAGRDARERLWPSGHQVPEEEWWGERSGSSKVLRGCTELSASGWGTEAAPSPERAMTELCYPPGLGRSLSCSRGGCACPPRQEGPWSLFCRWGN